jgi:hypothetical protein
MRIAAILFSGFLLLAGSGVSQEAHAQKVKKVVTGVSISCPEPYKFADGKCSVDPGKLDATTCKGKGLAWSATPPLCVAASDQAPSPVCAPSAIPSEFDVDLKQCVAKDVTPVSSLGDYMGDCFRIRALPAPPPTGLVAGHTYEVLHQRAEGESDRILRLADANGSGMWSCGAQTGAVLFEIKASDLVATGADRAGWTYGVLALPYKLHSDDRSFGSGVSIGPYFGRRWGTPGSAYTFALAATIGSVKGEVKDSTGSVTSTPDLMAFSAAAGFMWDISKAPGAKPFKIGMFLGADVVGSDKSIQYKHNKKPWLAFQIGFDFTDN